jgi:hypothetical protein
MTNRELIVSRVSRINNLKVVSFLSFYGPWFPRNQGFWDSRVQGFKNQGLVSKYQCLRASKVQGIKFLRFQRIKVSGLRGF